MSARGLNLPDTPLDEAAIASKVTAERIRVFADRSVSGALTSPLGTGLLAWILGGAAGWKLAVIWLVLINLAELLILGIGYRYQMAKPAAEDAPKWGNRLIIGNTLAGLAWGSSVWFFWVDGEFILYLLNLMVLVGVSAICVIIMSPLRNAMLLFSAGILLPPLLHLLTVDNPYAAQISVGLVILFITEQQYSGVAKRQLDRELENGQRNLALVEQLTLTRSALNDANQKLTSKNAELSSMLERVRVMATRDELTGAFNRRFIGEQLERQVALKARHGTPASIVMLDLDHFKKINDRYGHSVGDQALKETVRAIDAELREGDVVARFGGEEFLVLLPVAGLEAASQLAERLRAALAKVALREGQEEIHLRASFGIAELRSEDTVEMWLRRADLALYEAKEKGRDCVVEAA
ncbi:MAG: GGDEF domain-containing protein [Sulfuritalea sp.]|nr:GGDEF domain-containing protein [Sulfuritalea sp.]